MTYIIILNWKGAIDTIACLLSVLQLQASSFRIVICDNGSPDNSYDIIRNWIIDNKQNSEYLLDHDLVELNRVSAESYCHASDQKQVFLVATGDNLGYAGGNNVGIKLALNNPETKYVWVLNNDTEVDPESLNYLVERCEQDTTIGICGSRLVYSDSRDKIQGLGGLYNPILCTTKHYAAYENSQKYFDDNETENQIDFVIGASMLLRRSLLDEIGLLDESYFLYFEELDIALRAKGKYRLGSASKSIVYHKEGASTGGKDADEKSDVADFYAIRNRIKFTLKHNRKYIIFVWLGLFVALGNRLRRKKFSKSKNIAKIILGIY